MRLSGVLHALLPAVRHMGLPGTPNPRPLEPLAPEPEPHLQADELLDSNTAAGVQYLPCTFL